MGGKPRKNEILPKGHFKWPRLQYNDSLSGLRSKTGHNKSKILHHCDLIACAGHNKSRVLPLLCDLYIIHK